MNRLKYSALLLSAFFLWSVSRIDAAVPSCGGSGVLNVGIIESNEPYSGFDASTGEPFGFDVDLVLAIARLVGYKVNFVLFPAMPAALNALATNQIDLIANSFTFLDPLTLADFGAVVTDISGVTNEVVGLAIYRGYLFNRTCCRLMYQFEAAINTLVTNGTYADLLQLQRQDPRQQVAISTFDLGYFSNSTTPNGILVAPLSSNSSMAGTIPSNPTGASGCRGQRAGAGLLPASCMAQFALTQAPVCFGFTAAVGSTGPTGGTGCLSSVLEVSGVADIIAIVG